MTIKKKEKERVKEKKEVLNHIKANAALSNEKRLVNRPYSNMPKIS